METDAIISVAPCRECLDMYNYLKQVSLNYKMQTNVWHTFALVWHIGLQVISKTNAKEAIKALLCVSLNKLSLFFNRIRFPVFSFFRHRFTWRPSRANPPRSEGYWRPGLLRTFRTAMAEQPCI